MIVIPQLTNVTAWEFPEDKEPGKAAFIAQWENPVEMWIRAYAFTLREVAEAIIEAAKTAPQHVYVDRSQTEDANQLVLVKECAAAPGVDITVGTSPDGPSFIAHSKSTTGTDGRSWMGSWNFSESASSQVNHAFQWVDPGAWRNMVIEAFNRDVAYAWASEPQFQVQGAQPQPRTA
jgi:hypothetical protein